MSRTEQDFSTPAKDPNPIEDLNPRGSRKRKQIDFTSKLIRDNIQSRHSSASPLLKKSKDMPACRSPNPIMKATLQVPSMAMDTDQGPPVRNTVHTKLVGPQDKQAPVAVLGTAPALIDPEFLSKMDKKMDLLTAGMMSISSRVDEQGKRLTENSALIAGQAEAISTNAENIAEIFRKLENIQSGRTSTPAPPRRSECSQQYRWARRSIRIWPIPATNEDLRWEGVGDFLQDKLKLDSSKVSQEDIRLCGSSQGRGSGYLLLPGGQGLCPRECKMLGWGDRRLGAAPSGTAPRNPPGT